MDYVACESANLLTACVVVSLAQMLVGTLSFTSHSNKVHYVYVSMACS
jgi:hypothetical protein